ncbi:alpha/beta hydrolase [Prosthecochloris sp. SCSIO W1103]|uniref:alpha/beta hydrolase n=1 Tax=Prosthecochloris sp. SCSIO W1103 TaxID=2992244 RepID=UPI00223D3171|nr:dienelactone hydrolase family protein [Prosthecochloris sp. SCSIO W1103]UZJ38661.1 dienelactone hydrolase family protein [Prosthecochloris sp. SCSIO W1103]
MYTRLPCPTCNDRQSPSMPEHYFIKTEISGRYVIQKPSGEDPFHLIVGFHGYGQLAEDELALLKGMTGNSAWLCCAVEALHPFYKQKGMVGANWMTSRNRELMIQENISYVTAVITELEKRYSLSGTLVYHGFSMGAAMAARSALLGNREPTAVMFLGGNIPPEHEKLGKMKKAHIARGNADRLYTQNEFERDKKRLNESGVPFEHCCFPGGHEADEQYLESAGVFLEQLLG